MTITEIRVRFVEEPVGDLIGYGSCLLGGSWRLDDIQLRHGRDGRLVLVFPTRLSASGTRHYVYCPISKPAGEAIRDAFVAHLSRLFPGKRSSDEIA